MQVLSEYYFNVTRKLVPQVPVDEVFAHAPVNRPLETVVVRGTAPRNGTDGVMGCARHALPSQ